MDDVVLTSFSLTSYRHYHDDVSNAITNPSDSSVYWAIKIFKDLKAMEDIRVPKFVIGKDTYSV